MDNLEKAEKLAKEEQSKIEAEKKAAESVKKETESKGAEKTEGKESILESAEKQAENDARILSVKDEELSDEDKTRKTELVKAKAEKLEKEETVDDKIKRTQESTQKRIDEVIGELKAEKANRQQDQQQIADLESELSALKKPKAEENKTDEVKQKLVEQIDKYLEEDKEKPLGERREIVKEEFEEWLYSDYVDATEWLMERNIRRREEKAKIQASLDNTPDKLADVFVAKQKESAKKLFGKYPSLIPTKDRVAELAGKSRAEIDEALSQENPEYALMLEIVNSDKKKYVEQENSPELVMQEMDRRKTNGKKVYTLTEEELQARIREGASAEAQRLANIDEGIGSSGGKKRMENERKSELRLKQESIVRKAGLSMEAVDARIEERKRQGLPVGVTGNDYNQD